MTPSSVLPDIVIVVLDCGRSFDFPGGPEPVEGMRFLESLRPESVAYPRAVSPSAWTVPGHASLFTGLYPWEHEVHMKSSLSLSPSVPTLASRLRDRGYATLSLSANGFIGPDFGLLGGFEDAAWGLWWEKFLRFPDRESPHRATWMPTVTAGTGVPPSEGSGRLPLGFAHRFIEGKDPVWMGPAVNLMNLGIRQLRYRDRTSALPVSPWIEPTLAAWLAKQNPDRPVFCFLNLLELHEPYVADPLDWSGPLRWGAAAFQRTDKIGFYSGRWQPSPREFARLRSLYRAALRSIDRRIARIVEILRTAGRWRDSLFVLTGDHGQAFGERGYLYHAARVWEPVVRVPLWVRWPRGRGGGRTGEGWASLIDVAPTALEAAGLDPSPSVAGRPLDLLVDRPRDGPVYSVADGLQGKTQVERLAPECVPRWDAPWVAAYQGSEKILFDTGTDRFEAHDVERDRREERDLFASDPTRFGSLTEGAREIAGRLVARVPARIAPEVDQLLRSWGYD